jgi:L-aspartate oxidase
MWDEVGLVRTASGLREAVGRLEGLASSLPVESETAGLATVGRLVATAALARPESRGAHFRADHPLADPAWRRRILLSPARDAVGVETAPLPAAAGVEAFA